MLAIAVAALLVAAVTIAGTRRLCGTPRTVLLEALPAQTLAGSRARDEAGLDGVFVSGASGTRRATGGVRLREDEALELRGWAADPAGGQAAAVFAIVDGGPAYRADYGVAPNAPNPPRRDGKIPFDVVVPAGRLERGAHEIRLRVVTRSLDGYVEPLAPLAFALR
jgi:hypothetical protein